MSVPTHLQEHLKEAMAGLRWETMNLLAQELMNALTKDGYRLDDLLQGLATYASKRGEQWEPVVKHLEEAADLAEKLEKGGKKK